MTFSDYKNAVETNETQTRPIYGIRSFNQRLFATFENKVVLSSFYDKMVLVDRVNCIPFGCNPKSMVKLYLVICCATYY